MRDVPAVVSEEVVRDEGAGETRPQETLGLKLDLGCGQNKREGFHGVDIAQTDGVDTVCDLFQDRWPFDDDTVDEAFSSHVVEHAYPVGGPRDGLIHFMNELHRVCRHDATVEIVHPYGLSKRAFQDPTHCRYLNEHTWPYFSLEARRQMKVDHYPITADFELTGLANGWFPGYELRNDAVRTEHAQHYWDVVTDLAVTLRAIKE